MHKNAKSMINSLKSHEHLGTLPFFIFRAKGNIHLTTSLPLGSLRGLKYVGIFIRKMTEESPSLSSSCKCSD